VAAAAHTSARRKAFALVIAFLTFAVVIALTAFAPAAFADPSEQVPIGPRAIGMGGAFTSIADDPSALFWNPAGLARIGHQEVSATHADLYHSGIQDNVGAFVLPFSAEEAMAMDWYHSGFDDGTLGFAENRVTLGGSLKVQPWLWAGLSAKLLTRGTSLDGASIASGSGFGMDLGLLAQPADRWRIGFVAQDVTDTKVSTTDGASQTAYPRNLRLGTSYSWPKLGTAAFDVDDRWHFGIEATPVAALALRFGVEDDRHGVESATWSYGVGLKAGVLRLDWARETPPVLSATDHFAVAFEFNFNPAQVRIEKVEPREIYTSLYKSYANEGVGTAQLRNLQDRPLTTRVSVFVPELMSVPSEQDVTLRPHAVNDVPLIAVLDEKVLTQRGDQPIAVQVTASYTSKRLVRHEKSAARGIAYAPGAIDWSEGMAQAAAFVTPRDPAVDELARQSSRLVLQRTDNGFGNRNVAFAAATTDALAELGVVYVPDPTNPFATISTTPHAVDTIHYPYQTIDRLSGDCDDTTVLMASMLGNVGVNTRFVDAPGHIFLIADTGLQENNRNALGVDSTLMVIADHEVWIPIETTSLAKGFAQAWRDGADEIATGLAQGPVNYVDVTESQIRYEPVLPPGERHIRLVDEARFNQRLDAEAKAVADMHEQFYLAHYGAATRDLVASADALELVARVDFEGGDLDGARKQLEQAIAHAPQSASAHNNLGVVLAATDSLSEAENEWRTAATLAPNLPGIALNLALARWAAGDSASSQLAPAVAASGGFEASCRLIGVSPTDSIGPAAGAANEDADLKIRVRNALRQAASAASASAGSAAPTAAKGRHGAPAQPAPGPKAAQQNAHQLLPANRHMYVCLYWIE
jgi:tetratricopeptide (TPR) repeat protein